MMPKTRRRQNIVSSAAVAIDVVGSCRDRTAT
ncbi:hypothetical protein BH11GEM2_BH11GEM2_20300 [soil metagenome]